MYELQNKPCASLYACIWCRAPPSLSAMAKSVGNEGSASVNWGRLNSARSASTTRMRSGSLAIWRFLPEYFVLVAVRRIPLGGGGEEGECFGRWPVPAADDGGRCSGSTRLRPGSGSQLRRKAAIAPQILHIRRAIVRGYMVGCNVVSRARCALSHGSVLESFCSRPS